MLKIIFILCFILLGLYAANRLDEKSQKKITYIVFAVFFILAVIMMGLELFR